MALEQANLCGGPCLVGGEEAQAECPRTQKPLSGRAEVTLELSAQSGAFIGPYPRVAMCHSFLVTQSTNQLVTPGYRQRFVSSKWTCFRGKTHPRNACH